MGWEALTLGEELGTKRQCRAEGTSLAQGEGGSILTLQGTFMNPSSSSLWPAGSSWCLASDPDVMLSNHLLVRM